MAEGDGACYNNFKEELMEGLYNLSSGNIRVALVTGYTPNIDTHRLWTDASGNEIAGTGYTANGKLLTALAVTQDDTDDEGVFDAGDVTWTGLNATAGEPNYAVMYDDDATGTRADALIAYWSITTATNGGDYTLQWATEGIINIG
jgi:hypothetical protein